MNEKRTEVRTFIVRLMCDKCDGEMLPTGIYLTSDPPQYPHKCSKCGVETVVHAYRYPRFETEEV